MPGTYVQRYADGKESGDWRSFASSMVISPEVPLNEAMGLSEHEMEDLEMGLHDLDFYAFKISERKHSPLRIWPGCYVRFAFQNDLGKPHSEFGWADVIDGRGDVVRIQCDDSYMGSRAVSIRQEDVLEVLPMKERPLVYYKTMLCGDCGKCPRDTNDFPRECPNYGLFNAVMNSQIGYSEFMRLYLRKGGCYEGD